MCVLRVFSYVVFFLNFRMKFTSEGVELCSVESENTCRVKRKKSLKKNRLFEPVSCSGDSSNRLDWFNRKPVNLAQSASASSGKISGQRTRSESQSEYSPKMRNDIQLMRQSIAIGDLEDLEESVESKRNKMRRDSRNKKKKAK